MDLLGRLMMMVSSSFGFVNSLAPKEVSPPLWAGRSAGVHKRLEIAQAAFAVVARTPKYASSGVA